MFSKFVISAVAAFAASTAASAATVYDDSVTDLGATIPTVLDIVDAPGDYTIVGTLSDTDVTDWFRLPIAEGFEIYALRYVHGGPSAFTGTLTDVNFVLPVSDPNDGFIVPIIPFSGSAALQLTLEPGGTAATYEITYTARAISPVPAPASLPVLAAGLFALGGLRRR